MKAVCNREGLLTAFSVASAVTPARSPKPILMNVKMEVNPNGEASLLATDLEVGIRYQVSGVTMEDPGAAILPHESFQAILRELPDETVMLRVTNEALVVQGHASRFELPYLDPAQFPNITEFTDQQGVSFDAATLSLLIKRTVFAAASENSRYALQSVLLDFPAEDTAQLVATDGRRLATMRGRVKIDGKPPAGQPLIPPRTLNLIQRVLNDPEERIDVALRDNDVLFHTKRVTLYSRLVEGRYPRYADVFPGPPTVKVPLVVSKLLAVTRQGKIMTSSDSKGVDFEFISGELVVSSRSTDHGQSEVRMPIGYSGDKMKVTFDPQLLVDALKVLDPEMEVTLEFVDAKKAAVLRTPDQYAYLIMPLTK